MRTGWSDWRSGIDRAAMDTSDIKLLRAFPVFMRERSVSRAGEAMNLSQPAATHTLNRLRQLLNDPLLLRSRGRMVPTERALQIEPAVLALIEDYDRLTRPSQVFDPRSSRRTFHISAPEFAERVVVPGLVRRLRQLAPGVRLEVHAPAGERAFELMERGELDMRVAWLIPPPVTSLRAVRLFSDRLVCVADRRHRALKDGITMDLFVSLPHVRTVGYSQTTTGRAIDGAIAKRGRKIVPAQVVQTFATMLRSIPGTDLVAIVPRLLLDDFEGRHSLRIHEPPLVLPPVRYAAYWHERNQKEPAHRWFRGVLADALRESRGASGVKSGPRERVHSQT